jgi:hypothetical protein
MTDITTLEQWSEKILSLFPRARLKEELKKKHKKRSWQAWARQDDGVNRLVGVFVEYENGAIKGSYATSGGTVVCFSVGLQAFDPTQPQPEADVLKTSSNKGWYRHEPLSFDDGSGEPNYAGSEEYCKIICGHLNVNGMSEVGCGYGFFEEPELREEGEIYEIPEQMYVAMVIEDLTDANDDDGRGGFTYGALKLCYYQGKPVAADVCASPYGFWFAKTDFPDADPCPYHEPK